MQEICSVFNSDHPYKTVAHGHDEFMVTIPDHGVMRFTDEENNWSTTLVGRQFLLVPPNWGHSTEALGSRQSHLAFYVAPDFMRHAMRQVSGDGPHSTHAPVMGVWPGTLPLHHLLLARKALGASNAAIDRSRRLAHADYLLLLECIAASISRPGIRRPATQRHGDDLVREISAHLAGNLEEAPSLDDLAALFNVSRRHLTRLFSEHAGETVLTHLQRLRVERAKELLEHTRLSVLEIAQAVGFQSPSHFAEIFCREVSVNPDEWRRRTVITESR